MKVEKIPSGEIVIMTPELYQEFCQGGCVPACHLTNEWINIGDNFHLSLIKQWDGWWKTGKFVTTDRDVMLSEFATAKKYNKIQIEKFKKADDSYKALPESQRGGCFRVNGKIVH